MKMDKENVTVKAESTGSLLAMNLILMVLSCVLFVGTTLAWFTDQTSGGVNRIQAGNLDAELWIGEAEPYTPVKLDPLSGAQPVSAGTAVSLQLHKLIVTEVTETEGTVTNVTISTNSTDVWNPGDIFISDVMQVKKVADSVPFDYKLELEIDPDEQSTLKAKNVIDFRIVDVSEISTVSTDENSTRTYDYSRIAACFPAPASQQKPPQNNSEETNEPTESTPIIWSSDVGWSAVPAQGETPTNVFSSELANNEEPTENVTPVQFVILAKLKQPNEGSEDIELRNPFSLIVTLKQLKAEHFEPAAKAGDAS